MMFCPMSALAERPWLCGTVGWFTDQLFHGGLLTGFWVLSWISSVPSSSLDSISAKVATFFAFILAAFFLATETSSGPTSILRPRSVSPSVFFMMTGLTMIGTPFFSTCIRATEAFWASATVIGAGLSVIRFLRFPLVTLESKRVETLSLSDFWARATVIGAGLSVMRFLRFPLVTLESKRVLTLSESDF